MRENTQTGYLHVYAAAQPRLFHQPRHMHLGCLHTCTYRSTRTLQE